MDNTAYLPKPIFDARDKERSAFLRENELCRFSSLSSSEIRDLAVVWSFYSGEIEGNTYTYVETETLLKDDISSVKKYEDAVMLKNLYNVFISVTESINKSGPLIIDQRTVMSIHSMVTDRLLENTRCRTLRCLPVNITGTTYVPPSDEDTIRDVFECILRGQASYSDPLERAIYLHCNMARLQPFTDGDKRTSRLLEAVSMMNADIIPVYSSYASDIAAYRQGLVHYYETGDYSQYKEYFLGRQLNRILAMLPRRGENQCTLIYDLLDTEPV